MWVFLNDAFFSIVAHNERKDLLLVRARDPDDINRVFPKARVKHTPEADYGWRAYIPRKAVAETMANEVKRIDYPNFKNSVPDDARHDAYSAVWSVMFKWGRGGYKKRLQPAHPALTDWAIPHDEPLPWYAQEPAAD